MIVISTKFHQTLAAASLIVGLLVACQPDVPAVLGVISDGAASSADVAIDASVVPQTPSDSSADSATLDTEHSWPAEQEPPTVAIDQPAKDHTTVDAKVRVLGRVVDNVGVAAATLQVGANAPAPIQLTADGRFDVEVPVAPGGQLIQVCGFDVAGNKAIASVAVTRTISNKDEQPPKLTVTTPTAGFSVLGDSVLVQGTATDDVAVATVSVQVGQDAPVTAHTDDQFAHFWLDAALGSTGGQSITVRARDVAGRSTEVTVPGATSKVFDLIAPTLTITSPPPNHTTDADQVVVKGTAIDAGGVGAVDVRVGKGPYQPAATTDAFATWQKTVALWPGDNLVKVRARDKSGLVATLTHTIVNTSGSKWSPPTTLVLRARPPDYPEISFSIDRAGLSALLPPAKADQIKMLALDVRKLVTATFAQIRGACGSGWHKPNTLRTSCPKSWGQAEINLWRLVTMTPANVSVAGTSIAGMADIAKTLSNWGLMDDFSDVLAASLGIGVNSLIVGEQAIADAMVANVIATHPNAQPDGKIPITLQDALTDLAAMGPKFDAVGKHTGFLDKTAPPNAKVMTAAFNMKLTATSNLAWHDGVDLAAEGGARKTYIALLADKTGPTFDDVLEFHFLDPSKFAIDGLAAAPTSDMTFKVAEHPTWQAIGSSRFPQPKGNATAWNIDPWLLEHTLVDAAFRQYQTHKAGCSYCKGKSSGALLYEVPVVGLDEAEIVVGHQGYRKSGSGSPENFASLSPNPAGWLRIWTLFGLGSPPKPQYVWDMILEVSQKRLLDGGVKQGQGAARFSLQSVPVGITSADMKAALVPSLQAQKSKLSELLMGNATENPAVDFWLVRGADNELRLIYVAAGDPVPAGSNKASKRGFFGDIALANKLSSVADGGSGDAIHEKLAVAGVTQDLFCSAGNGGVYRVQIMTVQGDEVALKVRRYLGTTP